MGDDGGAGVMGLPGGDEAVGEDDLPSEHGGADAFLDELGARPERIVLHYIGDRVEAEVVFGEDSAAAVGDAGRLKSRIDGRLAVDPYFRSISVQARLHQFGA